MKKSFDRSLLSKDFFYFLEKKRQENHQVFSLWDELTINKYN